MKNKAKIGDPLSPLQHRVLSYAATYISFYGYPPSHREISIHLNHSSFNALNETFQMLVKKGYIRIERKRSRAYKIVCVAVYYWDVETKCESWGFGFSEGEAWNDLKRQFLPLRVSTPNLAP